MSLLSPINSYYKIILILYHYIVYTTFMLCFRYLNDEFGNNWIGQRGPHRWPPRSPDLNPLDFFFWGYLKDNVFKFPRPANVQQLRDKILQVSEEVSAVMLRSTVASFYDRLGFCLTAYGHQFEHLL